MTRRAALLGLLLIPLVLGCSSAGPGAADLSRGMLTLAFVPNPIMAVRVQGNIYQFPFEISIRETGGVAVNIEQVTVLVKAFGTLNVYSQTMGKAEIAQRGFETLVPEGGELHYEFRPVEQVTDERLFSTVRAHVFVKGTDSNGHPIEATTEVRVRR